MILADSIQFLKGAVLRGTPGILGCYCIREGFICANNEYMQAGALYMGPEGDFNIPAEELEAALGRMQKEPAITLHEDHIIVKHGRLKSTIQKLPGESPPIADLDNCNWLAMPPGFTDRLKQALPFCGDQGWTAAVRLTANRIVAINNRSGIDISFPGMEIDGAKHLATNCVEFLISAGQPSAYACVNGALMVKWPGEQWARFQMLASAMPESVDKILEGAQGEAPHAITNDWRLAFEDIAALSDGDIEIHNQGIEARKGAGRAYVEMPDETITVRSRWSIKVLEPMIKIATHWAPNSWPNASPFAGPGFAGLVMGVRI